MESLFGGQAQYTIDGSNAWPQRATWFTVVAALSLAERGGALPARLTQRMPLSFDASSIRLSKRTTSAPATPEGALALPPRPP
eukprot:scaffold19398_cov51-Phaeocystis_antarctica.AAC.4